MLIRIQSHLSPAAAFPFSSASFASREGSLFRYSRLHRYHRRADGFSSSSAKDICLSTCSFTLPVAFSLARSFRLRLWSFALWSLSLAAFCLSPVVSYPAFRLPLPVQLYPTCLMISQESFGPHARENLYSSLPPPISVSGPYVSLKTNDDLLAFAADMSCHPKFASKNTRRRRKPGEYRS